MIRALLFSTFILFSFNILGQSSNNGAVVDRVGGIEDLNPVTISIFPNPATHYFRVTDHEDIEELIITDLMGKRVKSFPYQREAQYDVQDLRKGMYLIQIVSFDSKVLKIQRLIKNAP